MGTRNLVCVVLNHEYKIAQYGQWDGYPSGQGLTLLHFLRDRMDKNLFLTKLTCLARWVTDEEVKEAWAKAGHTKDKGPFVSFDTVAIYDKFMPFHSRDHGAKVLEMIQDAPEEPILLRDSHDFAADSLFCEYAYVVDFDNNTFEVYKGFNEKLLDPLDPKERFSDLEPADKNSSYYPVRHWHTFDLKALPTDEEFLAILQDETEEEELNND